jgi:hypothetical protein
MTFMVICMLQTHCKFDSEQVLYNIKFEVNNFESVRENEL